MTQSNKSRLELAALREIVETQRTQLKEAQDNFQAMTNIAASTQRQLRDVLVAQENLTGILTELTRLLDKADPGDPSLPKRMGRALERLSVVKLFLKRAEGGE